MIADITAQLREQFDPDRLDDHDNIAQLHTLIHLKETDPGFHRYILDTYGFLTYAFQDSFGFGLPLSQGMLSRIGIFDNTLFLMLTKGEEDAYAYAREWTVSTSTFSRWKRAFAIREERVLSAYARGTLDRPSSLESAVLGNKGITSTDIPRKKQEIAQTLRDITEESLTAALHLNKTNPALYREAVTYFGRLPSALRAIGITDESILDHLIDTRIIERMLKLYLLGRNDELDTIKTEYKIHQRNFNRLLTDFERRRKEDLRENANTAMSEIEHELDSFFHETLLDEETYLLHVHHEPYRGMSTTYTGKMTCDFKIGVFWIEVAGGLDSNGFFPLYEQSMAYKRGLAADMGEQLIILETKDFRRQGYKDLLAPIFRFVEEQGIAAIIPPDLFNFRRERLFTTYLSSEGQAEHFKNRDAWWNPYK